MAYTLTHEGSFGGQGLLDNCAHVVGLSNDNLAITDINNRRIVIYDFCGNPVHTAGERRLSCPWHVCAAQDGRFVVSDGAQRQIIFYNDDGTFIKKIKLQATYEPYCVTLSRITSDVYVSGYNSSVVYVHNEHGHQVRCFRLDPDPEVVEANPFKEHHNTPNVEHFVMDLKDRLWTAFGGDHSKIHVYDTTGKVLFTVGGFQNVTSLHVTAQGRLVVVDRDAQKVELYAEDGSRIQQLLCCMRPLMYPHSATIVRGNMLVLSAADDFYTVPDKIHVYSIAKT